MANKSFKEGDNVVIHGDLEIYGKVTAVRYKGKFVDVEANGVIIDNVLARFVEIVD